MAPTKTVGNYVSLRRGTTYKGNLVGKPGPALLGLGSIQPGGGFREGNYKTYGGDCPPELMLVPGDLYVSLKGATKDGEMIGSVARVPTAVPSGRLTQDTVKLVFQVSEVSESETKRYLYWLLRTPDYRAYCAGRATGSAVVALSRQDFLAYPVPPLTGTRTKIVALLEAIEERLRVHRSTMGTLEAMARALFKSWFVDFDPARAKADGRTPSSMDAETAKLFPTAFVESELGPIPKGWRVTTLGEMTAQRREGIDPGDVASETPYIGLEHMPQRSVALGAWGTAAQAQSQKARFSKGDILFGKLRPYFHKVGVAAVDGVCSTDIVVVQPGEPAWFGFALGHLSSDAFVAFTTAGSDGTRMPRTNWARMASYQIVVPDISCAAAFDRIARVLIDRVHQHLFESHILAALRDTLLPRILSGELSLARAESAVEATA